MKHLYYTSLPAGIQENYRLHKKHPCPAATPPPQDLFSNFPRTACDRTPIFVV